jgi:hypothetical protein
MPAPNQDYGTEHAPFCASGDRAERRGFCDCGAEDRDERPWRLRVDADPNGGKPCVHVLTDRELSLREAVELALSLQELTRIEAGRWSKREMARLDRQLANIKAAKE